MRSLDVGPGGSLVAGPAVIWPVEWHNWPAAAGCDPNNGWAACCASALAWSHAWTAWAQASAAGLALSSGGYSGWNVGSPSTRNPPATFTPRHDCRSLATANPVNGSRPGLCSTSTTTVSPFSCWMVNLVLGASSSRRWAQRSTVWKSDWRLPAESNRYDAV